ncbi:chain length determinant protein EpsF [Azoarcus sp. KH32C]|uniref:chain length determinant protein EpsF n=1 Tax=Azoarcus sp. KH32C TaxID=748247 RepID=UPI0002386B0F|nr:chain length determinant protein EpsF [Azoarcus sp. KH32C]BAL23275.1 putative exopolysaccharide biosynthesis protein [Azoarcus sp. KH32C]
MTLTQFLRILIARRRLICAVVVIVLAAALGASLLLPKKYSSTVQLVVDVKTTDPILGNGVPSPQVSSYIATQADIIGSDRVALRVVEMEGLDRMPLFQALWQDATDGAGDIRNWIAGVLGSKLDVKPSRESNVISVTYTGYDPEFTAKIANAFARAYLETAVALKVEPARRYATWFNERTKGVRDELEAAQKRLSEYEQRNRIVSTDGRLDVETARLAELSSQLVQVQGLRAEARSRANQAGAGDALPEVMQNPLIANLKADLARREAEQDQLRGRLGPNHPEVAKQAAAIQTLRQRVSAETQRVAASLGTQDRVNVAREAEVSGAVEAQKARVLQLKQHNDQIAVLQRDVESAQKAYDQVTQRLAATSLESQTQQTDVAILTPGEVPIWPTGPRLLIKLALALVVGVVLGGGTALVLELGDLRVRGEDDLVRLPDMPVLGSIPGIGRGGRRLLPGRSRLIGRTSGGY